MKGKYLVGWHMLKEKFIVVPESNIEAKRYIAPKDIRKKEQIIDFIKAEYKEVGIIYLQFMPKAHKIIRELSHHSKHHHAK